MNLLFSFIPTLLLISVSGWAQDAVSKPHARYVIRTKTAVMGVRGLDEEDLKAAVPNEKAVLEMEQYAAAPATLVAFGRFKARELKPIAGGSELKLTVAEQEDELKMGRDIAATVLGAAPLVKSSRLQRYVNEVGAWIAERSERPNLKWRFGVLATDSINAFAVPGGYVFITQGLYRRLRTESELAGVLGHEITHIVSRDHYNILLLVKTMSMAGNSARSIMAGMPAFKQVAGLTLDRAASVFSFALDKSAEFKADQMGMVLAADAGYEPFGLPRVLQILALNHPGDPQTSLLFKTHPLPSDRLHAVEPLSVGRLASKSSNPDMKERFEEYDLVAMKKIKREAVSN